MTQEALLGISKKGGANKQMPRRMNGEGSFRTRTDGTIEGRIKIDGKSKSYYGKSIDIVKEQIAKAKADHKRGIIRDKQATFDDLVLKWLREVKKNEIKAKSYDRLESTIENHINPSVGFYKIEEIDEDILQAELINASIDKGLSYSSMKKIYDATNAFFKYLVAKRKLPYNPMDSVSKLSSSNFDKKEMKFLRPEEQEKLIPEVARVYKTNKSVYSNGYGILLMLYTGIREGELLGLKWCDFDEKNKLLFIRRNLIIVKNREDNDEPNYKTIVSENLKTFASRRVLPLEDKTVKALLDLRSLRKEWTPDEMIICSGNGKPWRADYLQRMFDSVLTNVGLPHFNLHSLRHTYASNKFKEGMDVKTISTLLGHSSVKITFDTYIHIIQEVEALKMLNN